VSVRNAEATPNGLSVKLIETFSKSELFWTKPFSADGVVAFRTGDVVQLWDFRSRTFKATLPRHNKILHAFFSSDGNTFVTSSKENSVGLITRLWDAQTGRLKVTLSGLVVFGPLRQSGFPLVVTLNDHNELKFWNAETGELQKTVTSYKRSFSKSIISPDGQLVVRNGGSKAFLWEATTGRLRAELKPPQERNYIVPWYHDITVYGALFSPDSKVVATEDSLNSIQLWDTETGRMRALLEGHSSTIYHLAFSSDGRLLASASRDGTARLWDVESGQLKHRLAAGDQIAQRVQFDPAGTFLAVGYHTQARLWDIRTGQVTANLTRHADVNRLVLFGTYWDGIDIMLSPDGRLLLTIGNKVIRVWNTSTGELVTTLEGHNPVAFSPDGKALAAGGRNDTVMVWAIEQSKTE
jgi:WD40 repeat protein